MRLPRKTKTYAIVLPIVMIVGLFALYMWSFLVIPQNVTLIAGNKYVYDFILPCVGEVQSKDSGVLSCNADIDGFAMNPIMDGKTTVKLKAFGFVPVKSMQVSVVPDTPVIVCGTPVGIKIKTKGVLVTGTMSFNAVGGGYVAPSKDAGIKPGDTIISVNNVIINTSDDMENSITKGKGSLQIIAMRSGRKMNFSVKPLADSTNGVFRIGLVIKDGAAGIGTMTFYEPNSGFYGALGHGISDSEAGCLYQVDKGEIVEAKIFAVTKGEPGNPGELKGYFANTATILGGFVVNNDTGIYGFLDSAQSKNIVGRKMLIGANNTVVEGKATILTTIGEGSPQEFEIEIVKTNKNKVNSPKGLVIKITDQKLLELTGGIVQGMSGSPIIQNGHLIGAVTHVMINDPTMGYGIFVEGMLNNIEKLDAA